MKRLKTMILAAMVFMSVAPAIPVHAIKVFPECGGNTSAVCSAANNSGEQSATGIVTKIINLMLFALGIVAVVMIIWAGIKYVTSRGDAANVKSAKDTITYAVVGLIVAISAYAIVNFVITSFK